MQFSIVITTYNRRSLLQRAIDSALAQRLPCEVVVADDCSDDGTQEYVLNLQQALKDAGDSRLVYARNANNSGHSATMNAGVARACGTWIKPLDDDDYLAPDCLSQMWQAIQRHPTAAICSCQAAQVDPQDVELGRTPRTGPGKAFFIPQEDIHYGMLLEIVPFGTPVQVAFLRAAFLEAGGWDSQFDGNCDDIDSWIKIAQFGDAIFVNQCLAYRTIWEGAYNRRFALQKRLATNILMKEKIYACVHPKYRAHIPDVQHVIAYLRLHWCAVALKEKHWREALSLLSPSVLQPKSWELFFRATVFRQSPWLARSKWFEDRFFEVSPLPSLSAPSSSVALHTLLERKRYQMQLKRGWSALRNGQWCHGIRLLRAALSKLLKLQLSHRIPHNWQIQKIPLHRQAEANAGLLEDIYDLLHYKYESHIPHLRELQHYIHLRWSWAALKQGKILTSLRVGFPAVLHLNAWRIWLHTVRSQHQKQRQNSVRRTILIEESRSDS